MLQFNCMASVDKQKVIDALKGMGFASIEF